MNNIYIYIIIMAVTTYLIRMIPLALVRKEIKSPFIKSFLFYVPYACLAAMTFPAIMTSTASIISGIVGFAIALILAFRERSMIIVAVAACAGVFVTERIFELLSIL